MPLPTTNQVFEYVKLHPECTSKQIASAFACTVKDINKSRDNYPGVYYIPGLIHQSFKHSVQNDNVTNQEQDIEPPAYDSSDEQSRDQRNEQIAALNAQLTARDEQIAALNVKLTERDEQVAALNEQVAALNVQLTERDEQVAALNEQVAALNEQVAALNVQLTALNVQSTPNKIKAKPRTLKTHAVPKPNEPESDLSD